MKNIFAVTDYKGYFGSKFNSFPYRSGFRLESIKKKFLENDYNLFFFSIKQISLNHRIPILLTSSEDHGNFYKNYLEDIFFDFEQRKATLIPSHNLFKAHNNKVYMELMRSRIGHLWGDKLKSWVFGCFEELEQSIDGINFPIVIKRYDGSMSRGVYLAKSKDELIKYAKKVSRLKFDMQELKDRLRPFIHKGYIRESVHRKKFILQQYIPNLENDWKILVFGERVFILTRHTRKNDFRASGSHCNYLAGSKSKLPDGILDYALLIRDSLDTPNVSLDVIFDGNDFHVVEFQAIHFGTSTCNMSDVYFEKKNDQWHQNKNDITIEKLYVDAVCWYLNK